MTFLWRYSDSGNFGVSTCWWCGLERCCRNFADEDDVIVGLGRRFERAIVGEGGDPFLVGFGDDEVVTRFEIRDVPVFGGGDGGDGVESARRERADDRWRVRRGGEKLFEGVPGHLQELRCVDL